MGKKNTGRGRAVLVTGASTGIGKAMALMLDKSGFRVFAGVRKEKDGEALISEASERLTYLIIDVTDHDSIKGAVSKIEESVGDEGLYGLFNNAGIAVSGPLELIPIETFDKQMRVNVTGVVAVTQACIPLLRKSKGRIVITGSESGKFTLPLVGPYAASKHAVEAIADSLRIELLKFGIKVTLLEPGSVDTPIWGKASEDAKGLSSQMTDQEKKLYSREITAIIRISNLQSRMAIKPEKVARVALKALTVKRPKTRYVIGMDARIFIWINKWVPTCLLDRGIASGIRKYGRR